MPTCLLAKYLAEQHSNWDSPYKFNAMELDGETGLYYFGVRYYDPKISMWMGVDPLQEKYPSVSPFAFAADNPVIDKMNGNVEQSALFMIKQGSVRKSVHLYMVAINSNNAPNKISNISALFTGTGFHEIESPKPERSVEDDPVKKRVKDTREKKLPESVEAKKEATEKEIKMDPEPVPVKPADLMIDEAKKSEVKSEKPQLADIKVVEAAEKKSIVKPQPQVKAESVNVPEKKTPLQVIEKKDEK